MSTVVIKAEKVLIRHAVFWTARTGWYRTTVRIIYQRWSSNLRSLGSAKQAIVD
jgi:hypothetical protein